MSTIGIAVLAVLFMLALTAGISLLGISDLLRKKKQEYELKNFIKELEKWQQKF